MASAADRSVSRPPAEAAYATRYGRRRRRRAAATAAAAAV